MRTKHLHTLLSGLIVLSLFSFQFSLSSCKSESAWEKEGVEVRIDIHKVSAGYVECDFTTNKDAYYLAAICQPWEDFIPTSNQKQFMQLALDSAYAEYLLWRNDLLRNKEFNVAPFSSHSLMYGQQHHFFTGLIPNREYWVFAFAVNPETMQPVSKLNIIPIRTDSDSNMDIHFDYRIIGQWDYIYPVDSTGKIYNHFPYIATTIDSITLVRDSDFIEMLDDIGDMGEHTILYGVGLYFAAWASERFLEPEITEVRYGVYAVKNDGIQSGDVFREGHTYFTALSGYDGSFKQTTIYRFVWTGDSCNYYFRDTDSANIVNLLSQ